MTSQVACFAKLPATSGADHTTNRASTRVPSNASIPRLDMQMVRGLRQRLKEPFGDQDFEEGRWHWRRRHERGRRHAAQRRRRLPAPGRRGTFCRVLGLRVCRPRVREGRVVGARQHLFSLGLGAPRRVVPQRDALRRCSAHGGEQS